MWESFMCSPFYFRCWAHYKLGSPFPYECHKGEAEKRMRAIQSIQRVTVPFNLHSSSCACADCTDIYFGGLVDWIWLNGCQCRWVGGWYPTWPRSVFSWVAWEEAISWKTAKRDWLWAEFAGHSYWNSLVQNWPCSTPPFNSSLDLDVLRLVMCHIQSLSLCDFVTSTNQLVWHEVADRSPCETQHGNHHCFRCCSQMNICHGHSHHPRFDCNAVGVLRWFTERHRLSMTATCPMCERQCRGFMCMISEGSEEAAIHREFSDFWHMIPWVGHLNQQRCQFEALGNWVPSLFLERVTAWQQCIDRVEIETNPSVPFPNLFLRNWPSALECKRLVRREPGAQKRRTGRAPQQAFLTFVLLLPLKSLLLQTSYQENMSESESQVSSWHAKSNTEPVAEVLATWTQGRPTNSSSDTCGATTCDTRSSWKLLGSCR